MQRRQKSYVRPRYYRQWTPEEEEALQKGVERHGVGSWESIRKDPELGILRDRTGVQLKDKWRNMVKFKSRHSEGLSGAMHGLDLSCHDGDALTHNTATTDDDQEGSTRSGRSRGRRARSRRPPPAHEDKRYGIYDVRRYMASKNGAADEQAAEGVVRCCCGATADDGEMMVECERCLVWSHVHCLQRLAATTTCSFQLNLSAFVCPDCQHHEATTQPPTWDLCPPQPTVSPFALPQHPPTNQASVSEESLVDSLASYAKHPEGKVHGGSLAMFALAASSLGNASDDLFAELPAMDDALAMEALTTPDDAAQWCDTLSAPRSCPERTGRWPQAMMHEVYGGGALAASLATAPCVPSTLVGRGGSPPSSMSYVSSGDVYGMTPTSSSVNNTTSSSLPSPMYSPVGRRGSVPPVARGGVTKVVAHPAAHRLDAALSSSTSTLEFLPKALWFTPPPEASSPDSMVASVPTAIADVELNELDTVLFNEHEWPLPC